MNEIISSYVLVVFNAKKGIIHKYMGRYSCTYNQMIVECKKRSFIGTKNMLIGFIDQHNNLTLLPNDIHTVEELEREFVCTALN